MVKRYTLFALVLVAALVASAKNIVSVNGYTATSYDPKTGTMCLLLSDSNSVVMLTTISNDGITHISYDAQGHPTIISTPNGSVSMPHYDNKQVQVSIVKGGKVVSETFDMPQREVPKSLRDILTQSQELMRSLSDKSDNNAKNYLSTGSQSVGLVLEGMPDTNGGNNITALLSEVHTGISKGKVANSSLKRMISKYDQYKGDWELFVQEWITENFLNSNCFVVVENGKELLICPDDEDNETSTNTQKGGSSSLKAAAKAAKAIGNTFRSILK